MIFKFFNFFFLSFFNFLKFKKLPEEKKDIIFYSENESQWDFFEGIIKGGDRINTRLSWYPNQKRKDFPRVVSMVSCACRRESRKID